MPSPFACTTCHQDPRGDRQGANIRNGFGFDYVAQRQDWSRLCDLDSDGDGITNAIELLDPGCEWRSAPAGQPNTPRPSGQATHPGDPDDPDQCGDGEIQGREECDDDNLNGATCASLGFLEGVLTCSNLCRLNQINCVDLIASDMALIEQDSTVTDMRVLDAQSFTIDASIEFKDASSDLALSDSNDAAPGRLDSTSSTDTFVDRDVNEGSEQDAQGMPPPNAQSGCTHNNNTAPNHLVIFWIFSLASLPRRRLTNRKER